MKYHVTVAGREFLVEVSESSEGGKTSVLVDGREVMIEPLGGGPQASEEGGEAVLLAGWERVVLSALPGGSAKPGEIRLLAWNRPVTIHVESDQDRLRALSWPVARKGGRFTARSTLPGVIRRILVKAGASVEEGTPILTLEAMKMENEVRAEARGRLHAVLVLEGQVVNAGDALAEIDMD